MLEWNGKNWIFFTVKFFSSESLFHILLKVGNKNYKTPLKQAIILTFIAITKTNCQQGKTTNITSWVLLPDSRTRHTFFLLRAQNILRLVLLRVKKMSSKLHVILFSNCLYRKTDTRFTDQNLYLSEWRNLEVIKLFFYLITVLKLSQRDQKMVNSAANMDKIRKCEI